MRKLLLFVFVIIVISCQAQDRLNKEMQAVFDACWAMRTAISSGNKTGLQSANNAFRQCRTHHFSLLRPNNANVISVNNHFVWDEIFVDSLIAGKNARIFAQRYADSRAMRGTSNRGGIAIRTCAVKGKKKATFTFTSKDHQELAVIAEPKGKITLRVHCKKTNIWRKDDKNPKIGEDYRIIVFDIPRGVTDTVELEVTNCVKDDISFVIISN